MKKTAILAAALCAAASLSVLAGCGGNPQNADPSLLYEKTENLPGAEVVSEVVPQKTESAIHSAEPSSEVFSSETASSETTSEEKVLTQRKEVNAGGITFTIPGTWDETSHTANTDSVYYAYQAPEGQGGLAVYPDAFGFLFSEDPDAVQNYTDLDSAIDKWYQHLKDRGSEMTRGETSVAGHSAVKFSAFSQSIYSEIYFVKTSGDKGIVLYYESNFGHDQMETYRDEIFSSMRF